MSLEGVNANSELDEILERNASRRVEALARAKAEAKWSGKESFDLFALRSLVDTSFYAGIKDDLTKEIEQLEYEYYVEKPSLKTLAGYADFIKRMLNDYVE